MNVLAIGAHPDDLENSCGGTLAKLSRQGHRVFMVHVSNGDVGHRIIQPEELSAIRRAEAQKAGARINAEVISLDARDLYIRSEDMELRRRAVDAIRYARPDFIITHNPSDYMDDHNETSKLVFEASMAATINHYPSKHEFYEKLCPIYYMEPLSGVDSFPQEFVDISEDIETKIAMLSEHQSQLTWLLEHDNIDILDMARLMARFRGYQCGVMYAEGFTYCKQFHKIPVRRYLP